MTLNSAFRFVLIFHVFPNFRGACAIGDEETGTVLITGGRIDSDYGTADVRVSRYNTTGWMEDIAELNEARALHACSSYIGQNEERVNIFHHP